MLVEMCGSLVVVCSHWCCRIKLNTLKN